MKQLEIYHNRTPMGILTKESETSYIFEYYDEYMACDLPPVSLTMPKTQKVYRSDKLFPFFYAMLPEGANKNTICRVFKIDPDDDYSLLEFFSGKDTIGSVNIKKIR